MPLLDIATAQPSLRNNTFTLGAQTLLRNKIVFGNEKRLGSGWKSFQVPTKEKNLYVGGVERHRRDLVIRAVATVELKRPVQTSDDNGVCALQPGVDSRSASRIRQQSSREYTEDLDEREKLRRMRISKANKGNTPWNKGRKHSAETIRRIRERTRLAMQDPKVKMKLVNLGHAQSKETRIKIGVGVRMGWERRREKLMLQETCYFEWQNWIAEASRRGFVGDEELQWDSYKILDEQLEQEWLESVEQRKKMPRPKGCRRAPKSLEQRRKISEAISAKWADPVYRDRVCSALSKYHGMPVGAQRKLRRRPRGESQTRTQSSLKKKTENTENSSGSVTKIQKQVTSLSRSNVPLYKDPLASSKLEMIKNIRAQRAAAETKKTEAIEQAMLLITEAEKAAVALEAAAARSPLARASLIETRKLIAEAIQSIQSVEIGQIDSHENGRHPSIASMGLVNHVEKGDDSGILGPSQTYRGEINGIQARESSKNNMKDFKLGKFNFQDLLNGEDEVLPAGFRGYSLLNGEEEFVGSGISDYDLLPSELDNIMKQSNLTEQQNILPNGAQIQSRREETSHKSITVTKKWVRGRLVEVVKGDIG